MPGVHTNNNVEVHRCQHRWQVTIVAEPGSNLVTRTVADGADDVVGIYLNRSTENAPDLNLETQRVENQQNTASSCGIDWRYQLVGTISIMTATTDDAVMSNIGNHCAPTGARCNLATMSLIVVETADDCHSGSALAEVIGLAAARCRQLPVIPYPDVVLHPDTIACLVASGWWCVDTQDGRSYLLPRILNGGS